MAEHAQTLTASSLCLLPRIIPAPQALLRPTRPQRLPEVTAKMAGVYSGVVLNTVGFFANIMHPLDEMKPFAFKVLEIKHTHLMLPSGDRPRAAPAAKSGFLARLAAPGAWFTRERKTTADADEEAGPKQDKPPRRQHTVHWVDGQGGTPLTPISPTNPAATEQQEPPPPPEPNFKRARTNSVKITDIITNPTMVLSEERYTVPPKYYSPHHLLSIFSCLLTAGIIVAAGFWQDGTAMLAITLISLAGSVVCYASWWRPILMHRRTTNEVPAGDTVIRTREGAFVLIKCTEEVARELYSGTEECKYLSTTFYRVFMGLGMVLLMVSVVLLGNCGWNSQVFIGGSYILLNGLYWATGLLPQRYFWDLGRYDVTDVTPDDARRAAETTNPDDPREGTPSFTRTLWYVIRETKRGAWVNRSGAMPGTELWKKWLREAVEAARTGNTAWEAVRRKNEIMKEDVDEAEQHAPLQEVQAPRRDAEGQKSSTF